MRINCNLRKWAVADRNAFLCRCIRARGRTSANTACSSPRSTCLGYTWKLNARPKKRLLAQYPPQPLFEPFWPRVNLSELGWSAGTSPSKDPSGKGFAEPAGEVLDELPCNAARA